MNKKILIPIIILFCGIIMAGVLYVYFRDAKVVGDLTHFMPKETELYIEYNLKDENLASFKANNFRGQVRFEKLIRDSDFFGELSPYLIEQTNKIALLVVPGQTGEWQKVWLVNSENIHKLRSLLPVDYFESMLDSKTLALSKSREVLKMIKEIEPMLEHSGEQRKILNKFSKDNFINIYLSGAYTKFLTNQPDPTYQLVLNNLDLDYSQPVFLGLAADVENNRVVYDFYGETAEEEDYNKFDNLEMQHLVSLPDMFLQFHLPNLKNIYNKLIAIIPEDKKQDWSRKYEFDWQALEDLLDNSGLIFVQSKSGPVDVNEIFDLEKYNYALQIQTDFLPAGEAGSQDIKIQTGFSQAIINKIKNVVKNILSFEYPVEVIKRLPDGTKTTELMADPEQFKFSAEGGSASGGDYNLEFIEHKKHRFVIGYQDNYLVMGNSKALVEDIIKNEGTEQGDGISRLDCTETQTDSVEIAIINSNQLVRGLLSYIDKTIINVQYNKREVNLQGCFLW